MAAQGSKKKSTARGSTGKATKSSTARKTTGKTGGTKTSAKNTNAKKSTRPATSSKSQGRAPVKLDNSEKTLGAEITGLLLVAVAVIFLLSNFGLAGSVGNAIQSVMFGLFGLVEYIIPFIMIGLIFVLVINKSAGATRIKSIAVFAALIFLSGICALAVNTPAVGSAGLTEFYSVAALEKTGGGFFGGFIDWLLSPIGDIASYVVLIVLLIICLVIITEKSFLGGVKNQGKKVIKKTRDDYEEYKENAANNRQLHEERRQQRMEERMRRQAMEELMEQQSKEADSNAPTDDITVVESLATKKEKKKPIKGEKITGLYSLTDETLSGEVIPESGEDLFSQIDTSQGGALSKTKSKKKGVSKDTLIPVDNSAIDLHEFTFDEDRPDEYSQDIIADTNVKATVNKSSGRRSVTHEIHNEVDNGAVADNSMAEAPKVEETKVEEQVYQPEELVISHPSEAELKHNEHDNYKFPPIDLLKQNKSKKSGNQDMENRETAMVLQQTLQSFGVKATVTDISCGPTVTRFELQPEQGVKVSKIVSLTDDIKLNLAAADIRIEAPIPGKAAVGIEVPNKETSGVSLRELLESDEFKKQSSNIAFAAGKDIGGQVIVSDLAKMPHLLIAGATGSGKSVCINTIIMSILYKAHPDDVKLIMVDPKVVELSVYNGIPHLFCPVVTDPKKAAAALNWAVAEMTDRYKKFADFNVRDLKSYNEKLADMKQKGIEEVQDLAKLPQMVIIVDELADLMMVSSNEVEEAICRLAQLARAAGIHLIIATQRPSVNVITGLIKANVPSRIAFSVASGVDSRTILDMVGAEKLLGRGDMLFYPSGYPKPVRAQGAFVSDEEVSSVVEFLKNNAGETNYSDAITTHMENNLTMEDSQAFGGDRDSYFVEAGRLIVEKEKGSIGMLQRYYKIGFNRAARIMDQLCDAGVVGPEEGNKPRKILMTLEEFNSINWNEK